MEPKRTRLQPAWVARFQARRNPCLYYYYFIWGYLPAFLQSGESTFEHFFPFLGKAAEGLSLRWDRPPLGIACPTQGYQLRMPRGAPSHELTALEQTLGISWHEMKECWG